MGRLRLPHNHPDRRDLSQHAASQSVKTYVNQMLSDYLSPMCDKL